MLTGWQKDMLAVKDISIGESTLNYTPFTITGILFKGFSAEVNPGMLYVAVSIGDELNVTRLQLRQNGDPMLNSCTIHILSSRQKQCIHLAAKLTGFFPLSSFL